MSSEDDETALARIESTMAHLVRQVEDLSETVVRQENEIALLTRRVQLLMEREAQRQEDDGGSVTLGDWQPPHW